jgi:hypothetical protein
VATPNYSYEKRQRELAKKRKAEEKRQRKQNRADDSTHKPPTPDPASGPPQPAADPKA